MFFKKKIIGNKLYLKPLDRRDASKKYLNWLNNSQITQFLEVRINPPKKIEDLESFILSHKNSKNSILFGIYINKRKLIGTIKIDNINNYHQFANIGIMIGDVNFHHKGYGWEAINLISNYAKENLLLRKLYAGCYGSNIASLKTFHKAKFNVVSRIEDYWINNNSKDSNITLMKDI